MVVVKWACLIATTPLLMPVPAMAQAAGPDPVLLERLATVPKTRPWPIAWFQPQETVKGSVARSTIPKTTDTAIAPEAIQTVRDYVMPKGTQALLIWHDNKLAHAEFAAGTTPAQQLNTYYMHTTALNLLYGIAIEEHYIGSIDDPVSKYLPEWANDPRGKITLRNVLNMATGLEVYKDSTKPEDKATRLFFGTDSTSPIFEYPAIEPPGKRFAYSYMVPELAGLILQRALKRRRYADYLSEKLWKPIGNGDAAVWLDRPMGRPHYNSSLFASAEDWLNIGKLILNDGRVGKRQVVPAAWIRTMKTPSATNPNYGMMWLGHQLRARAPLRR